MRSWTRPLGRFHPYALAGVLIASFVLASFSALVVLLYWPINLLVGIITGVAFGLAVGEVTIRQLWAQRNVNANLYLPEWKGDGLPPPGFILVRCSKCDRAGFVPAGMASSLSGHGICGDCAD